MLSSLCYSALRGTGLTALARHLRDGALILCYHDVVQGGPSPGDPAMHLPVERLTRSLPKTEPERGFSLHSTAWSVRRTHSKRTG